MSSAAKAKPVMFAVGLAEPGACEGDAKRGEAGAKFGGGDGGDTIGLGVTTVDPQAARSSTVATRIGTRTRLAGRLDNNETPGDDAVIAVAKLIVRREEGHICGSNVPSLARDGPPSSKIHGATLHHPIPRRDHRRLDTPNERGHRSL
jgi:hypothetical protein